jgi:hypothetical protein
VPLQEILNGGDLTPFRRLRGGSDPYEREIEELFWTNPEEFRGDSLFARQPALPSSGRPAALRQLHRRSEARIR